MCKAGYAALRKVQKGMTLTVIRAYRIISLEATMVVAASLAIDLLAKKRSTIFSETSGGFLCNAIMPKKEGHLKTLGQQKSFHLIWFLTRHGRYSYYLHRFRKTISPACVLCENPTDDAKHTLFKCDAFYNKKRYAEAELTADLTPKNIVTVMLHSKNNWDIISNFIITTTKNKDED